MATERKNISNLQGFPLNSAQKAAAMAGAAPLLIVAGAGTGKTRTLIGRIAYLIGAGIPPSRICAITFTNKAAKEMLRRLPPAARRGAFIGTFHSLGARILRRECKVFGREPNFVIFDDHDSFDLLKKVLKEGKGLGKKDTPAFFAGKISEMKNVDAPADAKESPERRALVKDVAHNYEEALARNNAFDFDDLIQKPVALFRARPQALRAYQDRFDAILVDEYQDINPKQYELVKLLAAAHRNLSVVGDDEQTIYSWRYADIRTFLGFEKEWPGARVHFLEENYRSTKNIIRAAGAVAANNHYRTPKNLWTANPDGELITLFEAWGENDEAEWIAGEIQRTIGAHAASGRAHEDPEVAILYRTNAQSRAIEQALIRRGIPYQIFGGLKFYERREVKDAVAALRWASNAKDELARERLEKNLSKKKFAAFARRIAEAGAAKALSPTEILKVFLEVFGYFEYLETNFLNADEREENIAELIGFASDAADLPDFLEKMSLLQSTDDEAAGGDGARHGRRDDERAGLSGKKVSLMTIHLAKGLEFKNVFVAGASEGLLPHIRSIDSESSLEEERRLMYVAMTRAKEKLRVSFYGMPSRFIAEMPEDCLEFRAMATDEDDNDGAAARSKERGGDDEDENVVQW